jgi:hypothetical protein
MSRRRPFFGAHIVGAKVLLKEIPAPVRDVVLLLKDRV